MRVRTLLALMIGTSLLVGAGAVMAVLRAAADESATEDAQLRAQRAAHQVTGLLVLTQEYARHSEARAAQQWHQRRSALQLALAEDEQAPVATQTPLSELQAISQAVAPLFERLEEISAQQDPFSRRRKEVLLDQLLTNAQAMSDHAYQWYRDEADARRAASERFQRTVGAALAALVALLLASAWLVYRRVLRPLRRLERATALIAAGDLAVRVGGSAQDELGQLSRRFDDMTSSLQQNGQRLHRSEQQLRAVTDNVPALIAHIDADQRYTFVNAHIGRVFGGDPRQMIGRTMQEVRAPLYEELKPHIEAALAGQARSFEGMAAVTGAERHYQSNYIPDLAEDGSVRGFFAMTFDITDRKLAEQKLESLARVDSLTGLPNRLQCHESIEQALARSRRSGQAIALMFLDIDHFKAINDALGHGNGDLVLCEFARRLRGAVRTTDTVGRLAGDEFVVLLEGLHSHDEPHFIARKILGNVNRSMDIDGRLLDIGTSIGVTYRAASPGGAVSVQELLAEADGALYEAKRAGRNTYRMAS